MPAYNHDQTILRLIKDVNDIQAALRHVTTNLPLYDIANENTPSTLVASQNNYNPGNFDVLRINATSAISITGFLGGKKGRSLDIVNISAFNMTLTNQSGSSTAANRIKSPSGENVVLYPNARVRLYYDSSQSRWLVPDPPSWNGVYGFSTFVRNTGSPSIPDSVDTKITFNTVVTNDWNMWDAANNRIVIPVTGSYMGVFGGNFDFNVTGVRGLRWLYSGVYIYSQQNLSVYDPGLSTAVVCPYFYNHTAGDIIEVYAMQTSGMAINFNNANLGFCRVR